jgi:transcriptional regulator with XRE-family HTH domain
MSKPIRNRRRATKLGQKLGKRIRSIRRHKEWTLESLAERAGMHVTYLSSLERGHRNPTFNVLCSLARGLSMSLSELLEGIDRGEDR